MNICPDLNGLIYRGFSIFCSNSMFNTASSESLFRIVAQTLRLTVSAPLERIIWKALLYWSLGRKRERMKGAELTTKGS